MSNLNKPKIQTRDDYYITEIPIKDEKEYLKYAQHFPVIKDKKDLEDVKNKILPGTGVTVIMDDKLTSIYKKTEKDKYTIGTFVKNIL